MADQEDFVSLAELALRLDMDFRDERAGGVENEQIPGPRRGRHRLRHAMRREHNWGAGIRDFVQFFDEDGALGFEALHHIAVMDDFMAHIDGRAVFGERQLHDLDRAVHTGAKTAGRGQVYGERRTVGASPIGLVGTGHRRLGRCVSLTSGGLSLALSRLPAGSSLRAKVKDRQPAIYQHTCQIERHIRRASLACQARDGVR